MALPVKSQGRYDFVKRNKSVGEEAFNNRLDILNRLNTDFQEDFGTRDSQSYMDTYLLIKIHELKGYRRLRASK